MDNQDNYLSPYRDRKEASFSSKREPNTLPLESECTGFSQSNSAAWKPDGFKGERMIVLPTESFQEYVEHPLVRRLYLTDVGYFPNAEHHYRERKAGIEEYIFFYCMDGGGTIEINDEKYKLRENDAFCIPRYTQHCYYAHPEEPWSILWVHFKGSDTAYYPLDDREIIHFSRENAAEHMRFLFDLLFRVLDGNYTLGNFIYISQVLSLILAETYDREKTGSAYEQNRLISNIIRYMQQHISENLTLDAVSRKFELSPSYLNAIFQKYTQHAPINFFISLKMKQACKLLRSTDQRIYEIANELGYTDPYYFSRIFKHTIGVSPRQYREQDFPHETKRDL